MAGDEEPVLVAECLAGLMAIDAERSLSFVSGFLDAETPIAVGAALAIGEARLPDSVQILRDAWDRLVDPDVRSQILMALGVNRSDEAFEFLLAAVEREGLPLAEAALEALGVCGSGPPRNERVAEAVRDRGEDELHSAYRRLFEAE